MGSPISLGIDLGTSELKAVLLDESGTVLAHAGVRLSISRPQAGWSEQDPEDWWQACLVGLHQLRQQQPGAYARVRCIGLSGQMHGAVLLDRDNHVLRPAILWDDSRALAQAQLLERAHPAFAGVTGSLPMAGLTAPKLLWLREHEPQLFSRISCVLSPKDYLRLRLTGERISDVSDAAGTLWLDVHKRDWFEPMLQATGLELHHMPRLVEGSAASADLSAAAASQLALQPPVLVAGGGGDNPVSAVGIGAIEAGQAFVTLGTSAAMVAITDHVAGNPASAVHSFCHALPQRWYTMGAMLAGASCLRWVTQLLGQVSEQALLQLVQEHLPLDQPLPAATPLFLPYLAGERTPHNDPLLRGGFMNLAYETTPAMFGYAVLEGVGFGLRDAMAAVQSAGAEVTTCSLVGGGARSDYWAQLLSNILDREICTLSGSELSACIGAAKLGFLAYGCGRDLPGLGMPVKERFVPAAGQQEILQERYRKFRGLFPAAQALHD
jgi:xylulokinase